MSRPVIEWGVAALTLPGQTESGDQCAVKHFPGGVLVGVVDALGHGQEAASAARIAVDTLERNAQESPLWLVRRCHEALRMSRGAVLSIASFSVADGTLTWLGVGNVEGVLLHRDAHANPDQVSLLLRGGVAGDQLPSLRASLIPVTKGDILVFATDGIKAGFADNLNLQDAPQRTADRILAHCARGTDDALVLVARYLGEQNETPSG